MDSLFDYPASVVEADTAVIFCLDDGLNITYCNPAWDRFALANSGRELCRPAPIGHCVLDYISGPDRNYYEKAYRRALARSASWEHEYECSSIDVYRKFCLRVLPMQKKRGLFVTNSLCVQHAHALVPCNPFDELYRNSHGLIVMCASCRRTRRNLCDVEIWDWVPDFVGVLPTHVTHGICSLCRELYYPEDE